MSRLWSAHIKTALFLGPLAIGAVDAHTAGPALAWAARREAGTRAVAVGGMIGGGVTMRAGARTSVVAEATYREFANDGSTADWLVPVTIGVEFR